MNAQKKRWQGQAAQCFLGCDPARLIDKFRCGGLNGREWKTSHWVVSPTCGDVVARG